MTHRRVSSIQIGTGSTTRSQGWHGSTVTPPALSCWSACSTGWSLRIASGSGEVYLRESGLPYVDVGVWIGIGLCSISGTTRTGTW